jgi:hypothetical protein
MKGGVRSLLIVLLGAAGCAPKSRLPGDGCSSEPDFVVMISAEPSALPTDTEVDVQYGGMLTESYRLDSPSAPDVLFCTPTSASENPSELGGASSSGSPTAGTSGTLAGSGGAPGAEAGGAASPATSPSTQLLTCELWTEGPASVTVKGSGVQEIAAMLTPDAKVCAVSANIHLLPADASL